MKSVWEKSKAFLPSIAYMVFYLLWFAYLEKTTTRNYTLIHTKVDDYIPFLEVFIIPYLMWFFYVAFTVIYLYLTNRREYIRACIFLFTGMTIFLAISTIFPNGHHLRPTYMSRDNIFTAMVSTLWRSDTATNLWPSIHVYNSIGAHVALMHSPEFTARKRNRVISLILCISIILSTMFLKQHSVFDVATAFIMAAIMHLLVYQRELFFSPSSSKEQAKERKIA
ncbi:MAG: phosphatase PAP2 family protein [Lachnospiraceae bacterium]|nr:phosphatase PAP2 family protein [Lachnospiraceae bacterium]